MSGAVGASGVAAFHVVLGDRQQGGEDDVPGGGDQQQRDHPAVAAVDHLDLVEELADRHHVDHRRALEQADDLVARGGQDGAHGLREHDPPDLPQPGDAERGSGLQLALVDGDDPAPDDLGGVRGLVQRQSDDRRADGADQGVAVDGPEHRPEGGMPTPNRSYRAPRLNQKTSWTIIGIERKIQM